MGASDTLVAGTCDPDPLRSVIGRFAPSPTGYLHAGNIFAYLMAWLYAKQRGGSIVLRIEDLDKDRSKPEYADAIMRDLESLGLIWDIGPIYQSHRDEAYEGVFELLGDRALLYPCFCTRADLHSASAPHKGEKPIYGGTCKHLDAIEVAEREREGRSPAMRIEVPDERIGLVDAIQGPYDQRLDADCGDFVIRKGDGSFAYQLAVVVDDAAAGVTSVVRGVDLLDSTPQQIYLQRLLGLDTPEYAHIPLLVDGTGRRLSKRNADASLEELLRTYGSPQRVLGHIAHIAGLLDEDGVATPEALLEDMGSADLAGSLVDKRAIRWR